MARDRLPLLGRGVRCLTPRRGKAARHAFASRTEPAAPLISLKPYNLQHAAETMKPLSAPKAEWDAHSCADFNGKNQFFEQPAATDFTHL
ncbi:hypothetical protein [Xanthomonas vasicola]|uniref:hypothetical protein n=1 Tax=Xanthomonas vasicola TaxID=56459 RepID=UPI0011CE8196|nr:hypothetical protein [Xanthomonas vasicola]